MGGQMFGAMPGSLSGPFAGPLRQPEGPALTLPSLTQQQMQDAKDAAANVPTGGQNNLAFAPSPAPFMPQTGAQPAGAFIHADPVIDKPDARAIFDAGQKGAKGTYVP
jgi:hypothetical protein